MRYANISGFGRVAGQLACWTAAPHKAGIDLADMTLCGYFIAPSATIYHSDLWIGNRVYIADRVIVYQALGGGQIEIGDSVRILRDTILESGQGGNIKIGNKTWIHPRCQINAYKASIEIGNGVDIAPNCAFYSYDHGYEPGKWIREHPLTAKGPIVIGDQAWLGVGVTVLSGVRIGEGAVVGAGSVVTKNVPDGAIAVGNPARIVKNRNELITKK